MRNIMIPSALVVAALISAPTMAEEVKSGLQVGDSAGAFNVKDCTGPNKGKSLCYRWRYGRNPVVTVFTRKITDDLASLVKEIDNTVNKNSSQNMKAFVVYLGDDPAAAEKKLQAMAKEHKITKTPLTVFQTEEGPPNYRISRDADVTVLMWSSRNVKANVAFGKKPLTKADIQKVVKSTAKILK